MRPENLRQTALRIPADVIARADALVPKLNARPEQRARGAVNRSDILRLALVLGMRSLERRLAQTRAR